MGDAAHMLFDKAQSKTFGATIQQLAKAALLSPVLAARFAALLTERNWLVYRSCADSRGAIHGVLCNVILSFSVIFLTEFGRRRRPFS